MQNGGEEDARDGTKERGAGTERSQVESLSNVSTIKKESNNRYS